MKPYYEDDTVRVLHGDCLDVLRTLPDASVDAVVTDPPYGLEFMGKEWDGADGFRRSLNPNDAGRDNAFGRTSRTSPEYRTDSKAQANRSQSPTFLGGLNPKCQVCSRWQRGSNPCRCEAPVWSQERLVRLHSFQEWCEAWTAECLRVLKPGGHLLAFGGTRTWHRLACAVEDAGFEVRDSIAWLYGSGFPKSLDVSKAIDKAAGAEREVVREWPQTYSGGAGAEAGYRPQNYIGRETSREAATDAARTWQGWGTALKPAFEPVVVARKPLAGTVAANVLQHGTGALNVNACRVEGQPRTTHADGNRRTATAGPTLREGLGLHDDPWPAPAGRWPANVVLDPSQAAALDEQSGETVSPPVGSVARTKGGNTIGTFAHEGREPSPNGHGDSGGASRFFYVAKADASERVRVDGTAHPTVKPLALMRWLVRLVTPPGGVVLEPFAGSGTTVEACILEGFRCIAVEREADYLPLIAQRIHRRRDPVQAVRGAGEDGGLFDLLDGDDAA